jgi:hypothetical protein
MKSYEPFVWPRTPRSMQEQQRSSDLVKLRGTGKAPAPAKELITTAGELKVKLSWTLPSEMGDIVGWRVYRDTESNRVLEVRDPNATSADIVVNDIEEHNFFVCAVNGLGRESKKLHKQTAAEPLVSVNQTNMGQSNTTNFCTVDSIDAGSNATIRVYGSGGVGTEWTRKVGSTVQGPYPAATLPGKAYTTNFYVSYNPLTGSYVVSTSYADIIPDHLIYAGLIKTVAAGGGGGTTGGGGTGGGSGGCVEVGTPVCYPEGSIVEQEEIACSDWVAVKTFLAREPVLMHPDTLVAVFKKASELEMGDRIKIMAPGAPFETLEYAEHVHKDSVKVKRTVKPSGVYGVGDRNIEVHNAKAPREDP